MKLSRKLVLGLLAAALAVSALTACGSSAPSAPSEPSNPDTSQGGSTGETPENPGGTEQPGGDTEEPDKTPDETPEQKAWMNSLAKAYLDQQGVTPENYHIYNTDCSAEIVFFYGMDVIYGEFDYFADLAVKGNERILKLCRGQNIDAGFYTDGQKYYEAVGESGDFKWQEITRQENDPAGEYVSTAEAKQMLDMALKLSAVPKASEISKFESKTTESGTTETVTMSNGVLYVYEFNKNNELKMIGAKVLEPTVYFCKYKNYPYHTATLLIVKNPKIEKGSQCSVFPTELRENT